jgi:thiol-disulfide isomerase/thioredoxin
MMTIDIPWRRGRKMSKQALSKQVKVLGKFVEVSEDTMKRGGKLFVFFMGAEYCPYCAAERWSIVRALQKYGQWDGLRQTMSAARDEQLLNLPTYDFTKSTYTSPYIEFTAREMKDREFRPLQKLLKTEEKLVRKFNPEKEIPFLLVGGRFVQLGSGFTPKIFIGHTFRQTETELKKAESDIRKTIDDEANIISALLCVCGLPPELCKETSVAELVAQARTRLA